MADNVAITPGTGATVAADDIGGVLHQRVKISQGADGSATDVSSAAPLQVTLANTGANATPVVVDLGANNDVTVTGTVTANLSATDNAVLDTIDTSTAAAAASLATLDNAIAGSEMQVDVVGALPAGTNAIGKLAANSGVDIGDVDVTSAIITGGAVAHDSADSGNPIKVGAKAITALSGATLVASADRADNVSDLDGAQIIRQDATLGDLVSGTASNTDGTSTQVLAAGAAGIKHYITDVTIVNTSSSTIYVELKDGATAKWVFPVPATGGVTHSFRVPLAGTAATAWNFDPSAATTTIYCSVTAFKSKV